MSGEPGYSPTPFYCTRVNHTRLRIRSLRNLMAEAQPISTRSIFLLKDRYCMSITMSMTLTRFLILSLSKIRFLCWIYTSLRQKCRKASIVDLLSYGAEYSQTPMKVRIIQVPYRQHITETSPLFGAIYT